MEKKIEEKKGMLILLLILLYQVIFVMVLYFSGVRESRINNLIWGILFLL